MRAEEARTEHGEEALGVSFWKGWLPEVASPAEAELWATLLSKYGLRNKEQQSAIDLRRIEDLVLRLGIMIMMAIWISWSQRRELWHLE